MIDHTEYMQSIVDIPLPLIQNSTDMCEKFIYRKKLATRYVETVDAGKRKTIFKKFDVVNDQIKTHFKLL